MPTMIGITAPTRAVAEEMNSASIKPTVIAPSVNKPAKCHPPHHHQCNVPVVCSKPAESPYRVHQ